MAETLTRSGVFIGFSFTCTVVTTFDKSPKGSCIARAKTLRPHRGRPPSLLARRRDSLCPRI